MPVKNLIIFFTELPCAKVMKYKSLSDYHQTFKDLKLDSEQEFSIRINVQYAFAEFVDEVWIIDPLKHDNLFKDLDKTGFNQITGTFPCRQDRYIDFINSSLDLLRNYNSLPFKFLLNTGET